MDHGLHEHPDTATSWMLPVVEKLLAHERIRLVKSHLCRFGLQVGRDSRMSKKSTLFATSWDAIVVRLQKLCQCGAQSAQECPPELVKCIVDGMLEDWLKSQVDEPELPDQAQLNQWIDELQRNEVARWTKFADHAVLILKRPKVLSRSGPRRRTWRWTLGVEPLENRWLQIERGTGGQPVRLEVDYAYVAVVYTYPVMTQTYAEGEGRGVATAEKSAVLRSHINLGHPHARSSFDFFALPVFAKTSSTTW